MITKSQIEEAVISKLEIAEGIVAKREMSQDVLTPAKNTVFIKVLNYQFPNEDVSEDYDITKIIRTTINIQVRIVYRTVKETSNISEFEEKVLKELTAMHLEFDNYPMAFVLRPAQFGETKDIDKDIKQSLNLFKIIGFLDFNLAEV